MNGERYLLDTNAVVALLRDGAPIVTRLKSAEWVGISVIS
jgi:predicted nucleic acid-binding protein